MRLGLVLAVFAAGLCGHLALLAACWAVALRAGRGEPRGCGGFEEEEWPGWEAGGLQGLRRSLDRLEELLEALRRRARRGDWEEPGWVV